MLGTTIQTTRTKALGLSKLKVSEEQLNLSYKTVCNWWDREELLFKKNMSLY